MTSQPDTVGRRPLEVTSQVQASVFEYYSYLKQAKAEGRPILLAQLLMPYQIFHAMDIPVLPLEHMGGVAPMISQSGTYCQRAEDEGISRDTCGFHRCFLGMSFAGEERDPVCDSLYTTPDFVVAANWPCMAESKSFLHTISLFNLPYFLVDAPVNSWGKKVPDRVVNYIAGQFKEMIAYLEQFGYKMDWKRLQEEIEFTRRVVEIQEEIEGYCKTSPSPMGGSDTYFTPLTCVHVQGQKAFHLLEKQRDEVKERAEKGIGYLDNERLRLFWIPTPPLYDFGILNYAEKHGAVVVKTWIDRVYCGFDPSYLDPEKPLESMAMMVLSDATAPNFCFITDGMVKIVKEFQIDGMVECVVRTCGAAAHQMRRIKDAVARETGVPTVMMDVDYCDSREHDKDAIARSLDSFCETLLQRKGA
jgi:benzoyl-CoA reductase/2-hydroxyglutaryl-CoA dehydratase subunit BcrC/BadD/HgdB